MSRGSNTYRTLIGVLNVLGAKQRKGPLTRHGSTLLGRMLDRHVARQTQGPQTAHRSRRACPTCHEHGHSGEPRNHQKDRANTSEQFIIWVTKHVWYRKCGSLTTLSTCQLWYNAKYQQTSHHSLQWTLPTLCFTIVWQTRPSWRSDRCHETGSANHRGADHRARWCPLF